ncbi:hypothetical protein ACHAXH_004758 [Discostella pseudostelligera]
MKFATASAIILAICGSTAAFSATPSVNGASSSALRAATATETYTFTKSEEIFAEAKTLMPGGVSSPVRAFKSVGGNPIVFDRVKGAYAWDVDGNKFIDYVGTWGPAILGHADDDVLDAVKKTMDKVTSDSNDSPSKGTSFGAPCALENELAKAVIAAVPSVEMVRFTNSGTEACMGMIRLCRAYTNREKVIKFEGCYHGHADAFLVQAGSGVATLGLPDSPGVPSSATKATLCAEYNNLDSVKKIFEENMGEIAAVILEPVVGNSGFIKPDKEFLQGIRDLCTEHGAVCVFDEVMTGFRVSYGGAQKYFGVTPDLTTMGKVIGGGLPVGAYGGKKEIMEMVAPAGPMYQAGTLSGNPLAMTAGIETMKKLAVDGVYEELERKSKKLVDGIVATAQKYGLPITGDYAGGMFGWYFVDGPVKNFAQATKADASRFGKWHRMMLERGVYLAPSMYEAGFMSMAHTDEDIDRTLAIADEVMSQL